MDPEPYDVLAVELSSFQLHYTDSMSAQAAAVLNVAEDHLDWYASMADVRRRQGPHLRARAARLRLQRRRPGHRGAGPRGRRGRGRPRHRLHARHARASGWSAWSRTSSPTAPSSRSGRPAPPSCARSPTWPRPAPPARRRTPSRTPWPRPPWPGRTASARPRSARGCAASGPTATGSPWWPSATASPGSTTPRPPTRTPRWRRCSPTTPWSGWPAASPRARRSTTWSGPSPAGCAARYCSAGTATSSPRLSRDTHRMCPSSSWTRVRLL